MEFLEETSILHMKIAFFLFQQLFIFPSNETVSFYTKFLKSSKIRFHLEMYLVCSNNFGFHSYVKHFSERIRIRHGDNWGNTFNLSYWKI